MRAKLGVAVLFILLAVLPVPGEDGRDFAGFYKVGEEVTDLGEEVRVTLTVRVMGDEPYVSLHIAGADKYAK